MSFENVSPELRERAKACKTTEELLKLAADEGIELTDEQLEAISGGDSGGMMWDEKPKCKLCGSDRTTGINPKTGDYLPMTQRYCFSCDTVYEYVSADRPRRRVAMAAFGAAICIGNSPVWMRAGDVLVVSAADADLLPQIG